MATKSLTREQLQAKIDGFNAQMSAYQWEDARYQKLHEQREVYCDRLHDLDDNERFPYTLDIDAIPTSKTFSVGNRFGFCPVYYACPDELWRDHLKAWQRAVGNPETKPLAPQPMPVRHCMFENPMNYGDVRHGTTDPTVIRAAHEHTVRNELQRWCDDPDRLERIVKATVDARMNNVDVGAAHYVACIYASFA